MFDGSWVCLVLACVLVLVLVLLLGVACAGLSTDEVFVLDGVITETLDWVSWLSTFKETIRPAINKIKTMEIKDFC